MDRAFIGRLALLGLASACVGEGYIDSWGLHERRVALAEACPDVGRPEWSFGVAVPTGVVRERLAVAAEKALVIGARASVTALPGKELATVAGLDEVGIGHAATVGSVYGGSRKAVLLSDEAVVQGYVKASGSLQKGGIVGIALGTVENVADPGELYRWSVTPPDDFVILDQLSPSTRRELAPGAYSNVVVGAGAEIVLHAGHYFFQRLELRSKGTLEIDDEEGAVHAWVREFLALDEAIRCSSRHRFLLGYAGAGTLPVAAGFCGTLVAELAKLELFGSTLPYRGAFFAESIAVGAGVAIMHEPFAWWREP